MIVTLGIVCDSGGSPAWCGRMGAKPACGGRDLRAPFVTPVQKSRSAKKLAAHTLSGRVLVLPAPLARQPETHIAERSQRYPRDK